MDTQFRGELYFSGCSCGCTPSTSVNIVADNLEKLKMGLAFKMNDYAVTGSHPFRKVRLFTDLYKVEDEIEVKKEVVELATKIFGLYKELQEREVLLKRKFSPPYMTTDSEKYPLTYEMLETNREENLKWEEQQNKIKVEADKLKSELSVYENAGWTEDN